MMQYWPLDRVLAFNSQFSQKLCRPPQSYWFWMPTSEEACLKFSFLWAYEYNHKAYYWRTLHRKRWVKHWFKIAEPLVLLPKSFVGQFLHNSWHWPGHLRVPAQLLTLAGAPTRYQHHSWHWPGHLRGTSTTPDSRSLMEIRKIIHWILLLKCH